MKKLLTILLFLFANTAQAQYYSNSYYDQSMRQLQTESQQRYNMNQARMNNQMLMNQYNNR